MFSALVAPRPIASAALPQVTANTQNVSAQVLVVLSKMFLQQNPVMNVALHGLFWSKK